MFDVFVFYIWVAFVAIDDFDGEVDQLLVFFGMSSADLIVKAMLIELFYYLVEVRVWLLEIEIKSKSIYLADLYLQQVKYLVLLPTHE